MDRRGIFKAMAATLLAVPFVGRKAQAATEGDKKSHRVAFHVDQNDVDVMKLALGNSRNAFELYKARGEEVAIEIVAYSQGLHMLRDDTSPVKAEIRDLRKLIPQVAFGACNNTKTAMEKREGKPVPIIAEATIVPAGVVRLIELQEAGYAYIKP
jgi:intracellular sulfur oxidation DsrE/DsrF family protein